MLSLIVARARNGAIGKDNEIPWYLPEDLKLFQRETLGGAIIMGRKTWDSLPYKPLKNRLNIVVSRDPAITEHVFTDPQDAVQAAYSQGRRRVYGIGGQRIYGALLPVANRLLITEVDIDIQEPDAFFPDFNEGQWTELGRARITGDGPDAVMRELIRKA